MADTVNTYYNYDNLNRLTSISHTDGTSGVSYTYDRRNRLISTTDVGGTHYFAYNLQNSLDNETIPYYNNRVVKYEYDNLGRNTKMGVYNTATNTWEHDTAYTYDSMSRLATLANLGKSATYARLNSSNRLSNVAFANDVGAPNINYLYDNQLRLVGKGDNYRYLTDKDEVGSQRYDFESDSHYYAYDAQGQLNQEINGIMSANGPVGTETNFTYDQIGNPLSNSFTYNAVNQPSNLTFDADGNMTKNGSTLYTYDAENRLKTMETAGNYKEFFYDYAGRCFKRQTVRKTSTTTVTVNEYLIYDKTKIIAVLNGSGSAITEKYTWQPPTSGDADVLLCNATSVYATDCNKNIVKRYYFNIDACQNIADTYSYTPFGTLTSGSATLSRFGFSSEEYYNGLYFYLYRAYNTTLKRWLTRDPIEEQGGVNLYGFVGNNPISYWDNWGWQISFGNNISYIVMITVIDPIYDIPSYRNNALNVLNSGNYSIDDMFRNAMKRYVNSGLSDCTGEIARLFKELYSIIATDEAGIFLGEYHRTKYAHGHNLEFSNPIHNGDGSAISHFLGGAWGEMTFEGGRIAQDAFELNDNRSGDWLKDTAYAYAGADFADFFDTWFDCNCRKIAKEFAYGDTKLSDLFGDMPPENTQEGREKYNNEFKKRLRDLNDKIFKEK